MAQPTLAASTFLFPTNLGWMAIAWRGEQPERGRESLAESKSKVAEGPRPPKTPDSLAQSPQKLLRLTIGHPSAAAAVASLELDASSTADRQDLPPWVANLVDRLQRYTDGETVSFDDVPVDLSHLTAFQLKVVRACRKISRGRTRTYGDLAAAAGSPGASRAVGSVMAKNRLPIIVPCHRVVGAGSLGGFSAPTGLSLKERMLQLEGFARKTQRHRERRVRR